MRSAFSYALYDADNIRLRTDVEGGSLMDVGCYCVSGSRLLAGEPESVFGQAYVGPTGTDWVFTGSLRFPGDVHALFDCGTCLAERDELEAIGTEGSLFLDDPWHCVEPVIELRRDGDVERIELEPVDSYRLELENLADAAAGRAPLLLGRDDAVGQARAIEALFRSADEGAVGSGLTRDLEAPVHRLACGSHWNVYVPSWSVTVHVVVPVPLTSVASSTPGPVRWKLWMSAWSFTSIVYVPGVSVVTSLPLASFRLMSKPGPTLRPASFPSRRRFRSSSCVVVVGLRRSGRGVVASAAAAREGERRRRECEHECHARACHRTSVSSFVTRPDDTRSPLERFGGAGGSRFDRAADALESRAVDVLEIAPGLWRWTGVPRGVAPGRRLRLRRDGGRRRARRPARPARGHGAVLEGARP